MDHFVRQMFLFPRWEPVSADNANREDNFDWKIYRYYLYLTQGKLAIIQLTYSVLLSDLFESWICKTLKVEDGKKCWKIYNAHIQFLFFSFNLLFSDVPLSVASPFRTKLAFRDYLDYFPGLVLLTLFPFEVCICHRTLFAHTTYGKGTLQRKRTKMPLPVSWLFSWIVIK